MRLATIEHNGFVGVGVRKGEGYVLTDYADMHALIRDGDAGLRHAAEALRTRTPAAGCRLLAPIRQPGKMLCSGINYDSHAEEGTGRPPAREYSAFAKLPSAIIGPGEPIVIPEPDCDTDYEAELAFVIGKTAKRVTREEALDYVFGYTVMNDVSERARQFRLQHETIGKGIDTFCPIGPEIVLKDEIPDPSRLRVRSYVNGELRQDSSTSALIHSVPDIIAALSRLITLDPGDLVSTGTPAGVGLFMSPPVYLKPGDRVVVEVDAIGQLSNPVRAGWR